MSRNTHIHQSDPDQLGANGSHPVSNLESTVAIWPTPSTQDVKPPDRGSAKTRRRFKPRSGNAPWIAVAASLIVGASIPIAAWAQLIPGEPIKLLAAGILVGWLGLTVVYYAWAIWRYGHNLGLTDAEWKFLHPEIYATSEEEKNYYESRRRELRTNQLVAQGAADMPLAPNSLTERSRWFDSEPSKNPYERDAFGLPPGTIRGTLALTALVMFLVVELVHLFDGKAEGSHKDLVTAYMMVLAFYFGSRAVEVLLAPKAAIATETNSSQVDRSTQAPGRSIPSQDATPTGDVMTPLERPAMPAHLREQRMAVDPSIDIPSPASLKSNGSSILTASESLEKRVLALTASFETGLGFPGCFAVATGNFDDQGLSYGALQWSIGMGTLQPLLQQMRKKYDDELAEALGSERYEDLCRMLEMKGRAEQVDWARSIQRTQIVNKRTTWMIDKGWLDALATLGHTEGMIATQIAAATTRFRTAIAWSSEWQLASERGIALMFDINVQNGKLDKGNVGDLIRADYRKVPASLSSEEQEVERMVIVASRRSEIAGGQWRSDVLRRKLTIARGTGLVHGRNYQLERDFGLTLRPYSPTVTPAPPVGQPVISSQYSPHFARKELLSSDTASRLKLDNTPDERAETNLIQLCMRFLEPVRSGLNTGLRVTSGYRSQLVNKAVGGSPTSSHRFGRAVDFVPVDSSVSLSAVVEWIRDQSKLPFDQVILEYGRWVHLGIAEQDKDARGDVLMISEPGKYVPYSSEGAKKLEG